MNENDGTLKLAVPPTPVKGRYDWVDYAKGIAIFLVVYRHSFEGLKRAKLPIGDFMGLEYANILFFSFRMPLFFIVSGMFLSSSLSKRGLGPFVSQKVKTILYPYFLWGCLQITSQILFSGIVNSNRSLDDYLLLLYDPKGVDQFWYLYTLFNVTALYAINSSTLRISSGVQVLIGLCMYYFSAYSTSQGWNLYFLNDILHYYVFIALGDFVGAYFRNPLNTRFIGSSRFLAVLLPLFILGQCYFLFTNLEHDPGGYHFVEDYQPTVYLLIALAGCAFMICISFMLQHFNTAKILKIIGFHSLYIYVSHVFVTSLFRTLLIKMGITYIPLLLFICIIFGIFLPIYFYRFCMSRGWYWFFTISKPRISTN